MNKERLYQNLRTLCTLFGPSGCEEKVSDKILLLADGKYDSADSDSFGNLILKISGSDSSLCPVMLSAHLDEVGFMIEDIDEYGYLHIQAVGGISPSVIPARRVKVECLDGSLIDGVISSKAIHLQSPDERKSPNKLASLIIDIGAKNREDALKYTDRGYFAAFESEYSVLGDEIKSKALDDRLGCAVLLELLYNTKNPVRDTYFAFTVREELGLSGALVAANKIRPEYAFVVETTAVSDIPATPASLKVAKLGDGGCVLFADRSTIYNRELFDKTLSLAKEKNIPCQIKKYVSGGNDSAHIHKSMGGVKTLALSAPSRYLHSSSCVVNINDVYSIYNLLEALIENIQGEKI